MKKVFLFFCLSLFIIRMNAQNCGFYADLENNEAAFAQQVCNISSEGINAPIFYPKEGDPTLKFKVNFIFFQRDDGEGSFNEADHGDFLDDLVSNMNHRISHLTRTCEQESNPPDCPDLGEDFIGTIKLEFDVERYYIPNTAAWDNDPNDIISCSSTLNEVVSSGFFSSTGSYMNQNATLVESMGIRPALNVFFTNDGNAYEDYLYDETQCWHGWDTARGAGFNDDVDRDGRVHMCNEYLSYLRSEAAGNLFNYRLDRSRSIVHEILHNFGLGDLNNQSSGVCECNIMVTNYTPIRNRLEPWQVQEIHDQLAWSNMRQYVYCDVPESGDPLKIEGDETWSYDTKMHRDIVIESGGKLTITCRLQMPRKGKIVVKPGGELIVNGGTVTYDGAPNEECLGDHWQGIVVIGNPDEGQWIDQNTGLRKQGYVYLEDATIENAVEAISVYDIDSSMPQSTTGGLVRARNSIFKNNIRSVHFLPYIETTEWGAWGGNGSWFTDCDFLIDDDFTGASFDEHVMLFGVKGLTFRSCNFENEVDLLNSLGGAGIRATDAGFSVEGKCIAGEPCTSWKPSSFTTLRNGIHATMSGSVPYTFVVDRTDFFNNDCGIYSEAVNNVQITRSTFQIGAWNPIDWAARDIGVFINTGTAYSIEENEFSGASGFNTLGVLIRESGDDFNQVFKNNYGGLVAANLSNRDNINETNGAQGLKYFCNINHKNHSDFAVPDQGLWPESGISTLQGGFTQPTGNTFSFAAPLGDDSDFLNEMFDLDYFYYNQAFAQTPLDYTESTIDLIGISTENQCTSNYDEKGLVAFPDIVRFTNQFGDHKLLYDSLDEVRNTLIDGGNTLSLTNMIASLLTTDGVQLKFDLLNISPYLSKAALEATAQRTDILSHTDIYDVLIANPDESRREPLIQYLENSVNPLPAPMIDALRNLPFTVTGRTILEHNWAYHYEQVSEATDFIIKHYLADSLDFQIDSIDYWLEQKGTFASELQRVDLWLAGGNTAEADQLLSAVPQNYMLSSKQATEFAYFKDLKTLQVTMFSQGESILDFDSTEVVELERIADESEWIAGQQARNILNFGFGYNYEPDIIRPSSGPAFRLGNLKESIPEKKITNAFPNPASEHITFQYKLNELKPNSSIRISNTLGETIMEFPIQTKLGFIDWNVKEVKAGLYFYSIVEGRHILESGQLVITH